MQSTSSSDLSPADPSGQAPNQQSEQVASVSDTTASLPRALPNLARVIKYKVDVSILKCGMMDAKFSKFSKFSKHQHILGMGLRQSGPLLQTPQYRSVRRAGQETPLPVSLAHYCLRDSIRGEKIAGPIQ